MIGVMWCQPANLGALALWRDARRVIDPLTWKPKEPKRRPVPFYSVRLQVRPQAGGEPNEYRAVVSAGGRPLAVFVRRFRNGKPLNEIALDLDKPQAKKVIRALRRKEQQERALHGLPIAGEI